MTQIELYNQIQNPLDNPLTIDNLIDIYGKTSPISSYYANMVKPLNPKNTGKFYRENADEFFAMLFNLWKQKAVSMTKEEFVELYRRKKLDQDFVAMRNYLISVPDVKTEAEANRILAGNTNNEDINDAIDKYKYSAIGEGSGWNHIYSKYIACKNESTPIITHRLYINVDSFDVYKLAILFLKKCLNNNVPYYFKFDRYAARTDTLVIYSSDEYLMNYISFLKEIKSENPELISRIGEPPLLTGNIDNWIGYGSEPLADNNGKKRSFNSVRAKIIESSISSATKKWILNNYQKRVIRNQVQMSFEDYFIILAVEALLKKYLENYTNIENTLNRNGQVSKETLFQRCGYTLEDLSSQKFKDYLFRNIKPNIKQMLESDSTQISITIPLKCGIKSEFNNMNLESILRHVSTRIKKVSPNYKDDIKQEIISRSVQEGIDPQKFCFDSYVSKRYYTQKPEELTASNITSYIDKSLIGKIKLPDGQIIDTKTYLENIVFPMLPLDGVIILKDNRVLDIKQFIEDCVLTECALKYNNNFARYFAENIKNNPGFISIRYQNASYAIKPSEIIKYINPNLLTTIIKLPNNQELTYSEFIKLYFSDFISPYGTVILKNGEEIEAIDFIENHLPSLIKQYNGNINRIIFNATRNNLGQVSINQEYTNRIKSYYVSQLNTVLSWNIVY